MASSIRIVRQGETREAPRGGQAGFNIDHEHEGTQMDFDQVELIDKDEHIEQASRAMKAMSHPLRLKILCVLGDREISVQDIVENVGTSQSNISQHLAILRDKGVLRTRKDANRVYYRVGDPRTLKLIGLMRDVFCGFAK
ncbi:MAG: metalloregulator ArsR/SmtB family transcription factor [Sulfuricella sp.]|nr:metalloregulator ArsR/SmtB family transcription factor [Sulfuricella sp.]